MAIKRIWHGWTTPENADLYEDLLNSEVFPSIEAKRIPGYRSIELLRRDLDDEVEGVLDRNAVGSEERTRRIALGRHRESATADTRVELDEEVAGFANDFLSLSPTCLKLIKKTYRHHIDTLVDWTVPKMIDTYAPGYYKTGEQQEGANAFLEKRAPDFSPWRKNL